MIQHEHYDEIQMGSPRSFGMVFAAVFVVIALYPMTGGGGVRWWAMAVGLGFGCIAAVAPNLLNPLNRLWFKFGLLIGKIVRPIIMAIIFFAAVVPTALIMRALGKDLLALKRDRELSSYWVTRDVEDDQLKSMRNQF